jgi:hypothetical protein
MPKYHMPNWEDSLLFKGQKQERKEKEKTPSDEPTVPSVQASEHLVHCAEAEMKLTPSDEPTVHFLVASDDLQRKSSEDSSTGWSDGLIEGTVGLSDAQFESRQRHAKTSSLAPDETTPWSRSNVGLFDGYEETNRDGLARSPSAPDEPTHRRCIASEQLCQRISMATSRGRGSGWTGAPEK